MLRWGFDVKNHGAFGPRGALVCEAVAAVPSTGGAVASLLAVGVGVVITAVLDVTRTDRWKQHMQQFSGINSLVS